MGRSCLLQAPSFVQDTPPRCIVHCTRSALYPFHHIREFVAIQAHLMASPTNVGVPFIIAWLLLFACKFSLKIFGEVRLRSQNFLFAFTIKLSCFARLGQTLRVIPLAKWVALAYCKLPHLCKILRLAASCTARARLCIRFTTSASSSQRELT